MLKAIVIGLDGATFKLLDPWLENGDLPNLNGLINGGTSSVMESCLPPVTSPNWKCYSTGKNPGKLGVFWWEVVDVHKKTINSVKYDEHIRSKEIWDWMNDLGYEAAVINMPTTYPPKKIKGCLIAGGPDCQDSGYTYPKELEKELKDRFGYLIHPKGVGRLGRKDSHAVKEVLQQIQRIFSVTHDMIKRGSYDFIHMTIFCTSVVQHFLWDDTIVKDIWISIDRKIGDLLSLLPEECRIMIMSDHGMKKVSREFYINTWLEENGYLTVNKGVEKPSSRMALYKRKIFAKINPFKRDGMRWNVFEGGIKEEKAKRINWEKSRAIASGQGPLYLICGKGEKEYESLRNEIMKGLKELKDPESGGLIMTEVCKSEDVYTFGSSDNTPDIVLKPEDPFRINGGLGDVPLLEECKRWVGENDPPGIFIAYGKDIKAGNRISDMNITDIAPTLLHWMNIAVPDDMDGRVLMEVFMEGSDPCKREIQLCKNDDVVTTDQTGYSKEEEDAVKERLKELGYFE